MNLSYFIERKPIEPFTPEMEAAGCCCLFEDKILLLKRHSDKPYGGTWGVPGGKMEKNEAIRACAIREVLEEAGLDIDDETLTFMGTLYCRINQNDQPFSYTFHLFQKKFHTLPKLDIGLDEHVEAKWVTFDEASKLPLIIGGKEVLDYWFNP
ncbi:MAG TPA: NUDIX hydrolase [Parachlamydiaceae bacterium]|nr:NUDIX hydrolase [Parachlamydiaceae bacterium]